MGFVKVILLSILLASTMCSSSEAYNFIIGGKNGWSLHPSENYSQWANRMRFQVNDTLSFRYTKETDSVVVVTKNDFERCNATKPIQKMDGGDSVFKFDRSGPFYIITGNKSNCDQGQKLIIVVLAIRNKSPPTPSVLAPSPAPENKAPVPSPENEAPGPSMSFEVPSVSPAPNAPEIVATPAPLSPANSPAEISSPPAASKSVAPAISPAVVLSIVLSVTVAGIITFT